MQRRRVWLLVGIVAGVVLSGIVGAVTTYVYFVASCLWPPDRVGVGVTNIPEDVRFWSVLSDSKGQIRLMSDYEGEVLQKPVKRVPRVISFDFGKIGHAGGQSVTWEPGDRYGVLVKSVDGTWRVFWFSAAEVPLEKSSGGFVSAELSFDLSNRTAVVQRRRRKRPRLSADERGPIGHQAVDSWCSGSV